MKKKSNDQQPMTKDLSIILPTFNEAKNIVLLINEIISQLKDKPLSYEIIVADDDSPDKTWETVNQYVILARLPLEALAKRGPESKNNNPTIHVLRRLSDHSLARSILDGINQSTGKNILVMDSDFNHDPKMIWQMYQLLDYYDIVIGSRFVPGGGMEDHTRNKFSFLYNLFIRVILGTHVQDNLSGFFTMKKELIEPFLTKEIFSGYGEYFIRLLFRARKRGYLWPQENPERSRGDELRPESSPLLEVSDRKPRPLGRGGRYSIIEVPVFYKLRSHGKSKSNFLKMALTYTEAVLEELALEVKRTKSLRSIFNR